MGDPDLRTHGVLYVEDGQIKYASERDGRVRVVVLDDGEIVPKTRAERLAHSLLSREWVRAIRRAIGL